MLEIESLECGYGRKRIIGPLSAVLPEGCVCALIGRNGTGKSTLLRTLATAQRPLAGRVLLQGRDMAAMSRRETARMVALVTTGGDDAGGLRVNELVALGRQPFTGFLGRLSDDDRKVARIAMERMGISALAEREVGTLSDGERQKAMIARALAQDTSLLLMDEPFSFLDVAARVASLSLLRSIARECGKGILLSTHDVAQALRMADMVWMFTPERDFLSGTPDELIGAGVLDRLFDDRGVAFDPATRDYVAH